MIPLRQLQHLIALAEHGHFGRAAQAMHITQSALTRSLQAAEDEVGEALFHRTRNQIAPTTMGGLLLSHARSIVLSMREMEREVRLARGLELGELRIGVGVYAGLDLVSAVIGRFATHHPRIKVHVQTVPWTELPDSARRDYLDLVVGNLTDIALLDDFEHRLILSDSLVLVCRLDHPLTTISNPGLAALANYPFAGPTLTDSQLQALLAQFPRDMRQAASTHGLLQIECDSTAALIEILRASDAVTMLPSHMVEEATRQGRIHALTDVPLKMTTSFGVGWVAQRTLSGPARRFLQLLLDQPHAALQGQPPKKGVRLRYARVGAKNAR